MTCYRVKLSKGAYAFLCGNLGPHCTFSNCFSIGENLCDYPVGSGLTCDKPLCSQHSQEVAPDIHYCPSHFKAWDEFRLNGGVKKELENVIPYKNRGS